MRVGVVLDQVAFGRNSRRQLRIRLYTFANTKKGGLDLGLPQQIKQPACRARIGAVIESERNATPIGAASAKERSKHFHLRESHSETDRDEHKHERDHQKCDTLER